MKKKTRRSFKKHRRRPKAGLCCACERCLRYYHERKQSNSLRPSKYPIRLKNGTHYTESGIKFYQRSREYWDIDEY